MDGHRRTQADAGRTPGRTDPYGLPDKSIDTSFDRLTQRQYCDMGGVGQGSSGGAAQQEGAWVDLCQGSAYRCMPMLSAIVTRELLL